METLKCLKNPLLQREIFDEDVKLKIANKINTKKLQLENEVEVLIELLKKYIERNVHSALNQEEYEDTNLQCNDYNNEDIIGIYQEHI